MREGVAASSERRFGFALRMSAGAGSSRDLPSAGELLETVDRSMYEAKRKGKDRMVTYSHNVHTGYDGNAG